MAKEIKICWTQEKGIHYRNNNEEITREELIARISKGQRYQAIRIEWQGVMPVNFYLEMQTAKSELEAIAIE